MMAPSRWRRKHCISVSKRCGDSIYCTISNCSVVTGHRPLEFGRCHGSNFCWPTVRSGLAVQNRESACKLAEIWGILQLTNPLADEKISALRLGVTPRAEHFEMVQYVRARLWGVMDVRNSIYRRYNYRPAHQYTNYQSNIVSLG